MSKAQKTVIAGAVCLVIAGLLLQCGANYIAAPFGFVGILLVMAGPQFADL